MVTSIALADVVADALGISRESGQLHLKTIRAAGEISFKGYGRAAAEMTPLDAARLLIAAAGSTFAKDSMDVLKRFAKLKPVRPRSSGHTLEEFLAVRIGALPIDENDSESERSRFLPRRPFGSVRLADTAVQLFDPIGSKDDDLPSFALVRWLSPIGDSKVLLFGREVDRPWQKGTSEGSSMETGTSISDILERYEKHRFFQVRVVRRTALIDIAEGLKGLTPSGNISSN